MTASTVARIGVMSPADPALQWFLDDAKRLGLSVREYEKRFDIILMPREKEVSSHETALDTVPVGAIGFSADPADIITEPDEVTMVRVNGKTLLVSVCDLPRNDCD